MKITKETIEHIANLSKLELSEQELSKLTTDMENIILYVDKLNELDTTDIEPTAHIIPLRNVFREDIVKESFNREDILMNAPSNESGCFKVPKIVE
jgi:aspartyl-tRNA(Asn)/glutamyl-tRNA(Gln) amidotransferase subunit C